jgi:hypothetical protein
MPELELYKDAILTTDIPAEDLRAGDVGTIVERHQVPGVAEVGYSVEFFDMTGLTVAVVTIPASSLRAPTSADLPSVRACSCPVSESAS